MNKIIYLFSYLRYALKLLLKFSIKRKSNRIIIVATPTHGNLGDQAIVYAEKMAVKTICPQCSIIEIENGAFLKCKSIIKKLIKSTDIIIIDGGGNLGTLWPWEDDKITDIIATFRQNKIIVFPQTMFYDQSESAISRIEKNREIYAQARDLTFLLRDRASFEFFVRTFPEIKYKLCPDIVLYLNQKQVFDRKEILLCLRSDREKYVTEQDVSRLKESLKDQGISVVETDTVIEKSVRAYNRKRELQKKWNEFSSSKLIITDRLHAMIFAFITGTPCIAINNSSKKVEGTFQFINGCNYIIMAGSLQEVLEIIPAMADVGENNVNTFVYPTNILEEVLKNGDTK